MKSNTRRLVAVASALFILAQSGVVAASSPAASAKSKPTLELGMSPEAVRQLIGQPAVTEPVDLPDGKGEVWTYRRISETHTRPVQTSMRQVPSYAGPQYADPIKMVDEPVYQLETRTVVQITRVLLLNRKLVMAKQWKESELNYSK